jgi:hypothetical protein
MNTRIPSVLSVPAVVVVGVLATASRAHAYLDPSTGSMLVSAVIGVLATAGLVLKTFWYRIRALFRRAEPPPDDGARPATRPTERDRHTPP